MANSISCRNKLTVKGVESESGLDLLVRLGCRPSLAELEPCLFPEGPQPGDVIEVTGNNNSGKTVLSLRLVVTTLLPQTWRGAYVGGCDAGVIFVDCDMHFSILQLENMMQRRIKKFLKLGKDAIKRKKSGFQYDSKFIVDEEELQKLLHSEKTTLKAEIENLTRQCLKSLFYLKCTDSSQYAITLISMDELVLNKAKVSLIVVDSISAYYWYDRAYRAESWYKLEQYYNKIFKVFVGHVKHHKLVLLSTRQSLFQKRVQWGLQNRSLHQSNEDDMEEGATEYEYMGKEWASLVSWKIHLSTINTQTDKRNHLAQTEAQKSSAKSTTDPVSVANKSKDEKSEAQSAERQIYFADVTKEGRKYRFLFTIHEDGLRWKI